VRLRLRPQVQALPRRPPPQLAATGGCGFGPAGYDRVGPPQDRRAQRRFGGCTTAVLRRIFSDAGVDRPDLHSWSPAGTAQPANPIGRSRRHCAPNGGELRRGTGAVRHPVQPVRRAGSGTWRAPASGHCPRAPRPRLILVPGLDWSRALVAARSASGAAATTAVAAVALCRGGNRRAQVSRQDPPHDHVQHARRVARDHVDDLQYGAGGAADDAEVGLALVRGCQGRGSESSLSRR
jgi:hypothetical protein